MLATRNNPLAILLNEAQKMLEPVSLRPREYGFNVDIKESSDKYTVLADLPGIQKEDIKLSIDKGHLTVSVEAKAENQSQEGETYLHIERCYSKRARTFYFGESVDEQNIKAQYNDGVLQVELLKKAPEVSIKEITIEWNETKKPPSGGFFSDFT